MTTTPAAPFRFSPRPNRAGEIAWRPWGDEAFAGARGASKPVLLGISAVWCHWCHVMDETSYSDPEVIRLINERYVAIRVDNDERPDVNRRYNMGGWPSTVFLTPDGEIIHGGTYLPPEAMRSYLEQVADLWRDKKDELERRVAEARAHDQRLRLVNGAHAQQAGALSWSIVDGVSALVRGQYDPAYGGFGREPKFPQPKLLRFLLDAHRRTGDADIAGMLHTTLRAMASGGMYDAVEGGFFRYATTRHWAVPHFEKMLEDNAELLAVYAEAHRTFPDAGYDRIVRDVIRWMDTVLWSGHDEAFAGSQDADEHYYTLDAAGRAALEIPFVDRTLYTSWNALAASARFGSASALGDAAIGARGATILRTLLGRMTVDGALRHFDRGDGPQVPDLLTDLAATLAATLDAYESGLHPDALASATQLAARMVEALGDPAGGFWDAPERDEPGRVSLREKPIEEGAVASDALLRLSALTGDASWRAHAVKALEGFVGEHRQWGQFAAAYGAAVARALSEPLTIVVVGPGGDAAAEGLWARALACDDPAKSLHRLVPGRDADRLALLGYPADRVAAYVCVGTVCSAPLAEQATLDAELERTRERFARD
ncbi:MAG: thioredoxin domain-containing protein [Chloroflexi bacterium]|nr:thioredoxin domain-containing protein [Chloroflexota bacterium]